jgi:hypothetical protein
MSDAEGETAAKLQRQPQRQDRNMMTLKLKAVLARRELLPSNVSGLELDSWNDARQMMMKSIKRFTKAPNKLGSG